MRGPGALNSDAERMTRELALPNGRGEGGGAYGRVLGRGHVAVVAL